MRAVLSRHVSEPCCKICKIRMYSQKVWSIALIYWYFTLDTLVFFEPPHLQQTDCLPNWPVCLPVPGMFVYQSGLKREQDTIKNNLDTLVFIESPHQEQTNSRISRKHFATFHSFWPSTRNSKMKCFTIFSFMCPGIKCLQILGLRYPAEGTTLDTF